MIDNNAKARSAVLVDANLFDIVDPISIGYSSTSIGGRHRLSYEDAKYDLRFDGDQITDIATPLGELVTRHIGEYARRVRSQLPIHRADDQARLGVFDGLLEVGDG